MGKNFRLGPGTFVRSYEKTTKGRLIYEVPIHVDQFGRRVTENREPGRRKQSAIFFGCSFTFGEGVSDGQTLPSQFARYAPDYHVYNYGAPGAGPFQALDYITSNDFEEHIAEKEGIGLYVFIDAHVHRVNPTIAYYLDYGKMRYFEEDASGALQRFENYGLAHPAMNWLYGLLAASPTLTYHRFDFPFSLSLQHYQRVARVIKEVAEVYRRRFGNDRFYVVLYPDNAPSVLPPLLDQFGLKYVDYQLVDLSQIMKSRPTHHLKDGHPSAAAYEFVARHLAADLDVNTRQP